MGEKCRVKGFSGWVVHGRWLQCVGDAWWMDPMDGKCMKDSFSGWKMYGGWLQWVGDIWWMDSVGGKCMVNGFSRWKIYGGWLQWVEDIWWMASVGGRIVWWMALFLCITELYYYNTNFLFSLVLTDFNIGFYNFL